jgi:ribosomal protein L40E
MQNKTNLSILNSQSFQTALNLAGLSLAPDSPLETTLSKGAPGSDPAPGLDWLDELGWLETKDPAQLTPIAISTLTNLADPQVQAFVILGTPASSGFISAYSSQGIEDEAFTAYLYDAERDEHILRTNVSPSDLTDQVSAQIILGDLPQTLSFQLLTNPGTFMALLCVLDLGFKDSLNAILNREPIFPQPFTVQDAWQMLVEGRLSSDLNWQVSLFKSIFTSLDFELDEAQVEAGLGRLQEEGLVLPHNESAFIASDRTSELVNAIFPLTSYASLNVQRKNSSGDWLVTEIAFLRGPASILLVQPVMDEQDQVVMTLESIDAVQAADLLFNLGFAQHKLGTGAVKETETGKIDVVICPQCGAGMPPELNFCTQCGANLVVSSQEK